MINARKPFSDVVFRPMGDSGDLKSELASLPYRRLLC